MSVILVLRQVTGIPIGVSTNPETETASKTAVSNSDLTSVLLILLLLVALAQVARRIIFVKLRQPKVVGEILAGVPARPRCCRGIAIRRLGFSTAAQHQANILNFVYWLGLLLLMFLSGAETQQLFSREERREVGWLAIVGTGHSVCPRVGARPTAHSTGPGWSLTVIEFP